MWGNLLGWCISIAMVAVTLGGIVALNHSLNSISAPTSFSTTSGVGNAIALPDGVDDLLVKDSGPADPATIYRAAISQYQSNRATFDHFAQSHRRDEMILIQPTLDLLVQASGNLPAAIFADIAAGRRDVSERYAADRASHAGRLFVDECVADGIER